MSRLRQKESLVVCELKTLDRLADSCEHDVIHMRVKWNESFEWFVEVKTKDEEGKLISMVLMIKEVFWSDAEKEVIVSGTVAEGNLRGIPTKGNMSSETLSSNSISWFCEI